MKGAGALIVKPISGKLTRDTEFMGKMDPYCVVKVGNQKKRTAVHHSAGKFPCWSDTLVFDNPSEDLLTIECWDSDTASADDLVGSITIPLHNVYSSGKFLDWVNLLYKGKSAGQIRLEIEWCKNEKESTQQISQNLMQAMPNYIAGGFPQTMPPQYTQMPPQTMIPQYPQMPPQTMAPQYPQPMPQYAPSMPPQTMPPQTMPPQNIPPQYMSPGTYLNPNALNQYAPPQHYAPPQQFSYPPQQYAYPPQQYSYPPQQYPQPPYNYPPQ